MIRNLILAIPVCLALTMVYCKNNETGQKDPDNSIKKSGDTTYIPNSSEVWNKLVIKEADTVTYKFRYTTTGAVRPLTGQLAEITSPYNGRIVNSFVKLGDKVAKGAAVFSLSSSEYFDALKSYRQSVKERELAEKNHNRKKELFNQGIISVKELDESALELEMAEKESAKDEAVMRVFNQNPEDADFSTPLIIRSPIAGEIVKNDITIGQFINETAQPQVIVANLEKIWVVAHVKEKDLGTISPRDQVEIFAESQPDKPVRGSVDYVGGLMEDQTRSVEVYIQCTNVDHLLKPGMFVTVNFYHNINSAIIIPSSAVFQEEESSFLWEQAASESFILKKISVVSVDNKNLLITSGITKGEKIVTEGGIYLR
jgi:membrane fusion protein, heavy metal efflux system